VVNLEQHGFIGLHDQRSVVAHSNDYPGSADMTDVMR
jgi:hypothetical protein